MKFNPPLKPAILLQRYQRFLGKVKTPNGKYLTIYCPNTGAMTGCAETGDTVWYSTSINPKRKYIHTWEITQTQNGEFICVNTLKANKLVKEAVSENRIAELAGYSIKKSEVKYGDEGSRIDFILKSDNRLDCYLEVKSVTLAEKTHGYFPDTKTVRGQKHIRELMRIRAAGQQAILIFVILHTSISYFSPASHIDLKYAQLLRNAQAQGVKLLAYKAEISTDDIALRDPLPISLF